MKQLKEFESWAENICEAAVDDKSNPKTKEISRERDIFYQASKNYPDRNAQQALGLFLADKLEDFDKRDLQQNKIINTQRKENEKLQSNLSNLQQEIEKVETSGQKTDSEINRLKALSGQLSSNIEQRKISTRDIENALAQVEELKNKPGMSQERYEELKKKLESVSQNQSRIDPEEFKTFTDQLYKLTTKQEIEKQQLQQISTISNRLELQQQDIRAQRGDIASKVAGLEKRQQELEQKEKTLSAEIKNTVDKEIKEKTKKYRQAVQARSKQAHTLIKNFLNTDLPTIKDKIDDIELVDDIQDQNITQTFNAINKLYNSINSLSGGSDYDDFEELKEEMNTQTNEELGPLPSIQRDAFLNNQLLAEKEMNNAINTTDFETKKQIAELKLALSDEMFNKILYDVYSKIVARIEGITQSKKLSGFERHFIKYIVKKLITAVSFSSLKKIPKTDDEISTVNIKSALHGNADWFEPKELFFSAKQKSFNEAIEKAFDDIIGEQVVRWIK